MIEYKVQFYKDRTVWYLNGKLHREDGPAIEHSDGDKAWYLNGQLHRENGPALEWSNGDKSWYLNGEELTEKEFNERMSPEVELTLDEIAEKFNIPVDKLRVKK
jgi:hypothetical protein